MKRNNVQKEKKKKTKKKEEMIELRESVAPCSWARARAGNTTETRREIFILLTR